MNLQYLIRYMPWHTLGYQLLKHKESFSFTLSPYHNKDITQHWVWCYMQGVYQLAWHPSYWTCLIPFRYIFLVIDTTFFSFHRIWFPCLVFIVVDPNLSLQICCPNPSSTCWSCSYHIQQLTCHQYTLIINAHFISLDVNTMINL